MIPAERHERIKSELKKSGFASVNELAERLGISISTVRRDLIDLENEGVVIRSRGGAGLAGHNLTLPQAQSSRAEKHISQKQKIGKRAAELIENSGCAILDAGTTNLEVARFLKPKKPLRIITDSIEIAYELRDRENVTVLVTGGILRSDSYNLYGGFGEYMLNSMHAQACVMGASGLTMREGLTKHDIEALPIRQKMVEISHDLICLADSSKFDVTGLVSICPIDRVDILITDDGIKPELRKTFEDMGIEVIIAE